MRSVNIKEARRTLPDLVDAVERGQSVLITRHGKEVARLGSPAGEAGGPLPDLTAFRASIIIKGKPLSKMVTESRRQARY